MKDIIKYIRRGDDLIIPDGVFFIPDMAFIRDSSFRRVIIGKDVTYIGKRAFAFCFGIEEVLFSPESKCRILLSECFMFCKNLKKINLPHSITNIEERSFLFNLRLKEINIPRSIEKIKNHVFVGSGIETIIFNNNKIKHIDSSAFMGLEDIKKIVLFGINKNVDLCEGLIVDFNTKSKEFQDVLIYKGRDICEYFDGIDRGLWWKCTNKDGTIKAYNKNMRDAFFELKNKLSNNIKDIALKNNWNLDTKINLSQYSLMSGNCWYNVKRYMETFGYNSNDCVSIREIMKISELQRNYSEFKNFVDKYIIKDDGTRNGIKIELKEEDK